MTKREELDLFLSRANELIDGKYILANIKIVNLLKAIASSNTLIALFKNCLTDFDYYKASKEYLVRSPLSDDKGEFITPKSTKDLLAFVFNFLMDVDSGKIVLGDFINKYFYEDGSMYSGYKAFINAMIIPFKKSVQLLMESVIDGKLQDPVEALTEEENKRAKESEEKEKEEIKEKELLKKAYGKAVKTIKEYLLSDKKKVKEKNIAEDKKAEITLVIDMLANVIESTDKDAIEYAFVAYKYVAKAHKLLFFNRVRKIEKLIKDVTNEL